VYAVPGLPTIKPGDELARLICAAFAVCDGDVLAVTSKVVSKAEGRVVSISRDAAAEAETDRVVARRGATTIARTRSGLVLAAAGVDASNVEPGRVVLLPVDPDRSARVLRESVAAAADVNVGVVITDTAGRAWRVGQTDIAVGCAGIAPLEDHTGRRDLFGNVLHVTAPAVADEVAAAADLVKGKLAATPVAVLRGAPLPLLPRGDHGPGAAALVREPAEDLFGLGAREAVTAAVQRTDQAALSAFPAHRAPLAGLLQQASRGLDPSRASLRPRTAEESRGVVVVDGLVRGVATPLLDAAVSLGAAAERLCALAVAEGWAVREEPSAPSGTPRPDPDGWRLALQLGLNPRVT
jgi:coenzyme F420-0:L-glutamate ligase/coenzyme F420-1:gamma-L-glutamate ligase